MIQAGIIGTGLLGSAITERWLRAGYQVIAFDIDREAMRKVEAAGAQLAGTPVEVWRHARYVALVLPNSGVSRNVMEESDAPAGTIVLDMTTGDPEEMSDLAAACKSRGIAYLDATVGGSSAVVRAGEAIVMAGGNEAAFRDCRGLLESFSRKVFYMGASGNGARMKLAMNLVLGLQRAVLAEGLEFAAACGLDREQALEVFRSGPAYSKAMDAKGSRMLQGDFSPEARLSQHRKDVESILRQAEMHSAQVPLSGLHLRLLRQVEQEGYGAEDNSAIVRAFQRR